MKKNIIPFFMLISILFISCKQAAFDKPDAPQGYGTVIIGIAGNEITRAVGENGLPVLSSAKMTIKVTKDNGTLIKKQDFDEDEDKTLPLTLQVGEKIAVEVTVKNDSAQWSGNTRHTVKEGTNTVIVKLKKSAVALEKLLFGTGKPHNSYDPYTLTLKIGSKESKTANIGDHNFCRDNKGRTYLVYLTQNTVGQSEYKLERYTSEGDKENKPFTLPAGCHRPMLASDHATGKVYLAAEISGQMKLYRINEDGTNIELTGAAIGYPTGYAVYKNTLIASAHKAGGQELKMYRINDNTLSPVTLTAPLNLSEDAKIMLDGHAAQGVKINDLYMTDNALYVLFSGYEHSVKHYSLGGIVKYSYTANGTITKSSPPIGIKNDHTADAHGIYATDDGKFYGPVKVIGFDEKKLYIADDGVSFKKTDSDVIVEANHNRIVALNYADNSLQDFKDAGNGITWNNEEKITKTGNVTITIGNDDWED